tara:strand:- start:320 stop:499 length:180 start_codon:yes stop_codon:yes gene_type:complete
MVHARSSVFGQWLCATASRELGRVFYPKLYAMVGNTALSHCLPRKVYAIFDQPIFLFAN